MTSTDTQPQTTTGSLIRAVEIWLPDSAGTLALEQSFYINTPSLEDASQALTFEPGQGLPGQVYETRTPIVFRDFESSDFRRIQAAAADGVVAGVGFPILKNDQCTAVAVMLFGADEEAVGAIESWVPCGERNETELGTSFYAGMLRFEKISRYVQFPKGSGLPGSVWESKKPDLLTGLSRSKSFMRAAGAGAEGLSSAVAWPVIEHGEKLHSVCVMLSAGRSPITQVMQVWDKHPDYPLVLCKTDAAAGTPLREACQKNPPAADSLLGQLPASGVPALLDGFDELDDPIFQAAHESGLSRAFFLPIYAGDDFEGAVAFWD